MNKQDYERLAQYMAFDADDPKPERDYTAARGIFAPASEPAEVSIRRLRGIAELPAQVADHQRVLEYEKRIAELEAALEWYADKRNYLADVEDDMGERARKALGRE